jgi:hypothetical protein
MTRYVAQLCLVVLIVVGLVQILADVFERFA